MTAIMAEVPGLRSANSLEALVGKARVTQFGRQSADQSASRASDQNPWSGQHADDSP